MRATSKTPGNLLLSMLAVTTPASAFRLLEQHPRGRVAVDRHSPPQVYVGSALQQQVEDRLEGKHMRSRGGYNPNPVPPTCVNSMRIYIAAALGPRTSSYELCASVFATGGTEVQLMSWIRPHERSQGAGP